MSGYERGFQSLQQEREAVELSVEGELPTWLDGVLLRNGPAQFEVEGTAVNHWFDGLAMLHRFGFDPGRDCVTYTNRFLRTDAYDDVQSGDLPGGFATGDSGGLFGRVRDLLFADLPDNANIHVARLGGEYVALTETPRGVSFDPETLETTGYPDFSGTTLHHTVAHLRRDDDAGETWGVGVTFGRQNQYRVFRIPDGTFDRRLLTSIPVSRPAYIHSFALTPAHVVLFESPLTVDPKDFMLGGGAFIDHYEWHPEAGSRILLVDRESGAVTERSTDPVFTFHLVNAFADPDDPESVVVDAVVYEDARIITDLELDGGVAAQPSHGDLRRFHVPLGDSATVTSESLYHGTELPRFAPDVAGQEYGYVYGQATERDGMNGLVKVDIETGASQEWWEPGLWAEEPIFVPEPDTEREDAGAVLATALDAEAERTILVVFTGTTFTECARIELPHAIPFGFHGEYFAETEPSH